MNVSVNPASQTTTVIILPGSGAPEEETRDSVDADTSAPNRNEDLGANAMDTETENAETPVALEQPQQVEQQHQ